ncbi:response regulator transcription factor [Rhodobacter sp. CZR27]|uniref:response regulator n=1 Tax=Rhodobacter sp. CZR27 TaxID=2033869 RepID=UPI000BBEE5D6|nr:response regulator transcription factor [Rhodobacter sp. CZR27]
MPETASTRILIADDHQLVRDLVAEHLAGLGRVETAKAACLDEALGLIAEQGPFDLVLLDLDMPGMSGLGSISTMLDANAPGRVLIFSGNAPRNLILSAVECGASGFIPKNLPARSLLSALRFVLSGETYLPMQFVADTSSRPEEPANLTAREIEVLKAIRSGLMNKEIALRMNVSEVAVKMHVRSICAKLNARNRTHAAMLATALSLH